MSPSKSNETERLLQIQNNIRNYSSNEARTNLPGYIKNDTINHKPLKPSEPVNDQTIETSTKERTILMLGLVLALFLAALDSTIVSIALPKIASEFNALSDIAWVGTAYYLSSTASQPLYGKLSDIFGRKFVFLFAIEAFIIGSVMCGAAPNMTFLIVSRGVAGVGCGGIISLVNIIITDIVPLSQRGKYQGIITGTFAISSVVGPFVGGILTDQASWRWAFYINIPLGLLAILVTAKLLNLPHVYGSFKANLYRVDYLGTIVFFAAFIAILLPLNWGGSKYAWNSPKIISLLVIGLLLTLLFIFIQLRIAVEPTISSHLFKIRNVLLSFIANFAIGIPYTGAIFYIPLYFQAVKGQGATEAGLQLIPYLAGMLILSLGSGFSASMSGEYRGWITFGYAAIAVGCGLMGTFNETTNQLQAIAYMWLVGAGLGCSLQTAFLSPQSSVNYKDIAIVTTLVTFFRSVGGIFGLAICGAIFNNSLESSLLNFLPEDIPLDQVMNSIEFVRTLPEDIRDPIIHAYVIALQNVFKIGVPTAGFATLVSLFVTHVPLRKTLGPSNIE
ncbi:hypothetical protein G9A89_001797 [Geosiphon pyriformis]|nr:hypothetical protein G9A89_001797 [Geosiphon pyriformis]